jgi:hypothetical protein
MNRSLLFSAIALLICSGCERYSTNRAENKVEVAVTAEQSKASEDQAIAEKHIAAVALSVTEGKITDDASKALASLYGGLVWKDKILAKYFGGKTTGYLIPVFEKRFTEGETEKYLVLGHITPEPTETYVCHACTPLIGGAIFVKQGSKWVVESKQKIIGWGAGLAQDDISIEKNGPVKYGVLIRIDDAHQGYEDRRERLLVPNQKNLDVALEVGYVEKPGPAACLEGNIDFPAQSVEIKFEQGNNAEYFDAVVHVEYNEGVCDKENIRINKTTRYQYHKGKYIPI